MKHLWICGLLVAACVAGGCSEEAAPAVGPAVELPAQSFKRGWQAPLDLKLDQESGEHIDRLFLREDLVIAYTTNERRTAWRAFAIDRGMGVVRYGPLPIVESKVPPIPPHPPVLLKERLVFPTNSTLVMFRRKDGLRLDSFESDKSLRTDAVGAANGSRIFFGVDAKFGRMAAVDTAGGMYKQTNLRWELMANQGATLSAAPAVWMDAVYVGFEDGWVYAVNAQTRQTIWSTSKGLWFETFGPIRADLKADEGGVYVPSTDSKLYCLDRTSGKVKWQFFGEQPLKRPVDVTATMVYLPIGDNQVAAIDKTQGQPVREARWRFTGVTKLVAEDEKFAYFLRPDNLVVALDKATGEPKFTSSRKDLTTFATNTKDGSIFASINGRQVVRIDPVLKPGDVGEIAWRPVPQQDRLETLAMD